ncbi:hybrid sensor histidine kinase/response regulator [Desulfobacter vibrioformis]|uniref:hybrid sensor histidine kinase/response regulator n=1 Tax=Desulfobacter vibrioformis TaxID=34031 RepID=UPI000558F7D6|nr:response regulator [Desulfobacter vibrioformis]
MPFFEKNNTTLIFPRYRKLSHKITGVLQISAVLFILFVLLILFLPALTGKPLCLIFFMLNGVLIILLLSWVKRMNTFMKETGLILSNSRDLMWAVDSRLNVTAICGDPGHISGHTAMALLNKPLASILPGDARDCFNTRIRENQPFSMECRISNGENSTLPVQILASPIHGSGQDIFHGVIRDISDQKKLQALEKELNSSKKLKNLGLLAGSVAHDLNNILAGIATYPEILLLEGNLEPKVRESLGIIKKSGQNASAVVNDLLTISSDIREECQILNINTIIARFMAGPEFKKIKAAYGKVEIDMHLEPELLTISGSYIHIEKSIMNLVVHALGSIAATAGPGNGTIVLSTANYYVDSEKNGHTEHHLSPGEYVMLEVLDPGKEIPQDCLNKIFEPFFIQKEMGRSGTGLGLTLVKNTVLDHRGKIFVASDETGTKFTLLFPALRSELPMANHPAAIEEIRGKGETLLVVDDLESQRKIAETILKELGYKVFSVANGVSAISFIMQTPVDLILLDMVMTTSISGLETYRLIKKIRPDQKAIIANGHSESEDVLKAQSLGAGAFIKKPYTILDMGIAVKEELDR